MDEQHVKNVAGTICEFLKKTDIKGIEVPTYLEVWNFLQAMGIGELQVLEYPRLKELEEREEEWKEFEKIRAKAAEVLSDADPEKVGE